MSAVGLWLALMVMHLSSALQEQWHKCGELLLPPQYSIDAPSNLPSIFLHVVSADLGDMISVQLMQDNGAVFCMCKSTSTSTSTSNPAHVHAVQVAIPLAHEASKLPTVATLTAPCSTRPVAGCQRSPNRTIPLLVKASGSEVRLVQANAEKQLVVKRKRGGH